MKTKKLYKVTLRGMTSSTSGTAYGISYVVAEDPEKAYQKVRSFLDAGNIGFKKDREMHTVELLAETYKYTDTRTMLFLDEG